MKRDKTEKYDDGVKIPEPLTFKFKLGQEVFYMCDNRVHSTKVTSRMIVENSHESWASTETQKNSWMPFGKTGVMYASCHGRWMESEIFATKAELLASL